MIVTTDAGARYEITEVGRGRFRVALLNPEVFGRRNPWTGESRDWVQHMSVIDALSLKIGDPLAFDTSTGAQLTPAWLRAQGYPDHNLITAIEP